MLEIKIKQLKENQNTDIIQTYEISHNSDLLFYHFNYIS